MAPKSREASRHQPQYQLLATSQTPNGNRTGDGTVSRKPIPASKLPPEPKHWKNLFDFTRRNTMMLLALFLGITGAIACFAFTYWLSRQIFYCPPWTVHCEVQKSVNWFASRLGFVQGFLSSIYGICIAMIAYAAYQFAETTIWPALTEHALTLEGIDQYLAHARGSLPSFPFAAWHARKPTHTVVVLVILVVGILLQASSTIVGFAFTLLPVSTILQSNHAIGGGMGFPYSQFNPPGPMPAEPSLALAIYSGWSVGQGEEMLPDLREYILDRTNFSLIGNFSVPAIHARKNIHCYGHAIRITSSPSAPDWTLYAVATANRSEFGGSLLLPSGNVLLRFLPNTLTAWVDNYWNLSSTRAVTRLVFATVNGTIENGLHGQYSSNISQGCVANFYGPCSKGISALACEVDIDLVDSQVRNGHLKLSKKNSLTSAKPLTSLRFTRVSKGPGSKWGLAVWLGAIPSMMGPNIWGAQPMSQTGLRLPNSSYALPAAYSDILGASTNEEWALANITNFVNVSSGALAIYIAQTFALGSTIVGSKLALQRLQTGRSFALLAPVGIALVSVFVLAILSGSMHRSARVKDVRLGWTSEILVRGGTGELKAVVDSVRAGRMEPRVLEEKRLWFGLVPEDGHPGLGTEGNVWLL